MPDRGPSSSEAAPLPPILGAYSRRWCGKNTTPLKIIERRSQTPSSGKGLRGGVGSLWVSRGRVTLGEPTFVDIEQLRSDIEQGILLDIRTKEFDMTTKVNHLGSVAKANSRTSTWVQTERSAHEAWAQLVRTNGRAAALLHVLVANMDSQAAVVASRSTLAQLVGYSEATVKRAVADLKADRWIEVIQLGGKGGVNAYVVNSRVAWADSRDKLGRAVFRATVVTTRSEQPEGADTTPLRSIPTLYPGESQLPNGPGEDPPSQPSIPGMEPDLPAIITDENGQRWTVDRETGVLQGRIKEVEAQP